MLSLRRSFDKPPLWLLLSALDHPDVSYVAPTVAWMAKQAGVKFECYFESVRDGRLFAETGSTVLGGHHHQQFNFLCAAFEVAVLRLGPSAIFSSSVTAFGVPVLAQGDTAPELYRQLLERDDIQTPAGVFCGPPPQGVTASGNLPLGYYLFPEILHRAALGAAPHHAEALRKLFPSAQVAKSWCGFLSAEEKNSIRDAGFRVHEIDRLRRNDTLGSITLRIARRWQSASRGVVFGDPPAVLSQLAAHCEHERVAVYEPARPPAPAAVRISHYAESVSPIAEQAAQLAVQIGNPVITGRQTGDGDIFAWSRRGVCIQIIDPNRPAFPAVEHVTPHWSSADIVNEDPSDEQLLEWARTNKILTSVLFHSGEVAHNEAMLALVELSGWTGLKLGLGVHAARYETCPQMWEIISIPRSRGGALGFVEPLLHSGGLGVMAECECPPDLLRAHCEQALARIRRIAGPAHSPVGYYAFMDSNLDRLDRVRGDLFSAIARAGLRYVVSSALPGRNRVLWQSRNGGCLAINQTPRVVHGCSPFVRATTAEDLQTTTGATGPGWLLATLDAPVIAFSPYIWRKGHRFIQLIEEEVLGQGRINVLPRVIARYARLLQEQQFLPSHLVRGNRAVTANPSL